MSTTPIEKAAEAACTHPSEDAYDDGLVTYCGNCGNEVKWFDLATQEWVAGPVPNGATKTPEGWATIATLGIRDGA